jgi:hypothetical protein
MRGGGMEDGRDLSALFAGEEQRRAAQKIGPKERLQLADVPLLPFKIGGEHTFYANRFVEVAGQQVRIPDGMDVKGGKLTTHFADPGVPLSAFSVNVLKVKGYDLAWKTPFASGVKLVNPFSVMPGRPKLVPNPSLTFTQNRLLYFKPLRRLISPDTETMMIPDGMQPVPRAVRGTLNEIMNDPAVSFSFAIGDTGRSPRKFDASWLYRQGLSVLTDAQLSEARARQASTAPTFKEGKYVRVGLMRIPDGMTIKNNKIPIMVSNGDVVFDMDFDEAVLCRDGIELTKDKAKSAATWTFAQNRYIAIPRPDGTSYGMRIPDDTRAKNSSFVYQPVNYVGSDPATEKDLRPYDHGWFDKYYYLEADSVASPPPVASPPTERQLAAKRHFNELREMFKTLPDTDADSINIPECTEWKNRLTTKAELGKAFLDESSTDPDQAYFRKVYDVAGQVASILETRIAENLALQERLGLNKMSDGEIADAFMGGSKKTRSKKPASKKPTTSKPASKKTTTASKPSSKKPTTASKPASKKPATASKPAASKKPTTAKAPKTK